MGTRFATTNWSLVLAARDGPTTESQQAFAELCEAYWYPLYAFVRHQGCSADDARDVTQAYFVRILETSFLRNVEPSEGRFRSFLLATLKNFLSKEREKERALKRGGRARIVSLDAEDAEARFRLEPVDHLDPQALFERRWALTVLHRAIVRLHQEFVASGREERFEKLHGYLVGESPRIPYREAAAQLSMSEGAVREAVRRLRVRFGRLLRDEIGATVADAADIDDEVRHLLEVSAPLGGPLA